MAFILVLGTAVWHRGPTMSEDQKKEEEVKGSSETEAMEAEVKTVTEEKSDKSDKKDRKKR